MAEKAPALGRYLITRMGPSHSRWEMPDGPDKGKPIVGQIPPTAVLVDYSAGKRPGDRNEILLTEAEAAKYSHMGLVRLLDGGAAKVIDAEKTVTAREAAAVHEKAAEERAAKKAAEKAEAKKAKEAKTKPAAKAEG